MKDCNFKSQKPEFIAHIQEKHLDMVFELVCSSQISERKKYFKSSQKIEINENNLDVHCDYFDAIAFIANSRSEENVPSFNFSSGNINLFVCFLFDTPYAMTKTKLTSSGGRNEFEIQASNDLEQ